MDLETELELREHDFVPLSQCEFQHWGERDGPPFSEIRPLGEAAAERVWGRVASLAAALSTGADDSGFVLDLTTLDDWDPLTVCRWLRSLVPGPPEPVLLCYQPRVVVSVPWDTVCAHWLTFFWTGACVYAPRAGWVLVHDGDRFSFARVSPRGDVVCR